MKREIIFLGIIGLMSYIYNLFIYKYVIMMMGEYVYNQMIIFIILLVKIDNISLYNELMINKDINKNNIDKINDKYMRIMMNQMTYIIRQNNDFMKIYDNKLKTKYKNHKSFTNKSCNDLHNIKND